MNRSQILRTAWDIARAGAATHGGRARDYIAAALRIAHGKARLIRDAARTLAAAGSYIGQDAPVRTGKWIVWSGWTTRANRHAVAALKAAGFIAFYNRRPEPVVGILAE